MREKFICEKYENFKINNIQDSQELTFQQKFITQVIDTQDKELVDSIKRYVKSIACRFNQNIELMLLDDKIADEIIKLGIKEYLKASDTDDNRAKTRKENK